MLLSYDAIQASASLLYEAHAPKNELFAIARAAFGPDAYLSVIRVWLAPCALTSA